MFPLFYSTQDIVLASASPRRQAFLQELGLSFNVVRPHGVEPRPEVGEEPASYARRAAQAKAHAVARSCPEEVVMAADTVVALGDVLLGKPRDAADALRMLQMLAGRQHEVITAVCLIFPGGDEVLFHDTTWVRFHAWSDEVLAAYAACGEPLDKAGAYAVQGQGAFLVSAVEGSWSTVVGLPVTQVTEILLQRGIISPGRQS